VKQLPKSVGAGNPHATFCGKRGRATASGDPVMRHTAQEALLRGSLQPLQGTEWACHVEHRKDQVVGGVSMSVHPGEASGIRI
jgi:hypothetical protein